MAKSTMRLAAGVALALAITVAGGPGAVLAAADPGSSGSFHGHSRDGGHSRTDSRGDGRGSHGFGGPRHDPGPRDDPGSRHDRGPRGGDYRDRDERGKPRGERPRDNPGVVETLAPTAQTAPSASRGVVPAAALAPEVPASAPQKPVRTGRAGVRPVVPAAAIVAPRVVVGNGRTPEARVETSFVPTQPLPVAVAPRPLTPVAPPAAMPEPMTEQAVSVPEPRSEPPAAALWSKVKPTWPTGAIFGIAGLLLAPIAGMWLGHRQARAAKSASQLVSR